MTRSWSAILSSAVLSSAGAVVLSGCQTPAREPAQATSAHISTGPVTAPAAPRVATSTAQPRAEAPPTVSAQAPAAAASRPSAQATSAGSVAGAPHPATSEAGSAAGGDAQTAALIGQVCSNCHDLAIVTSQRKSPAEWDETMQRMIGNAAPLTRDQSNAIVAYLSKTQAR